jgi:hypothetical protein
MQASLAVEPVPTEVPAGALRHALPLPRPEPQRGPSATAATLSRAGVGGGVMRAAFTFDYRLRDATFDRAAAAAIEQHWPAARDEVMKMLAGRPLREFEDGVRQVEADMIEILDRAIFAHARDGRLADVTGILWHTLLFQELLARLMRLRCPRMNEDATKLLAEIRDLLRRAAQQQATEHAERMASIAASDERAHAAVQRLDAQARFQRRVLVIVLVLAAAAFVVLFSVAFQDPRR